MSKTQGFKKIMRRIAIVMLFSIGIAPSDLLSQASSSGDRANVLPLSGRPGQSGSVAATQSSIPGTTTSVNTLNPTIQVQGPYTGSASSTAKMPFSGRLSFLEAIKRGVAYNLGVVDINQTVRQAHGQVSLARSALLPNLNGNLTEVVQQTDLKVLGVRFNIPGAHLPTVVGPFNYFDLRATLNQNVADLTAVNNYRSAKDVMRANQYSAQDARDLVILAVGGAYLQVIAAKARVESARAQLETSNAIYRQSVEERKVGVLAQIDVNRSQVQALTQQQRLVSLQNDLAKQKINLARLTGLPPQINTTRPTTFLTLPRLR